MYKDIAFRFFFSDRYVAGFCSVFEKKCTRILLSGFFVDRCVVVCCSVLQCVVVC
jgi:hypothetical protein